jgi:murein DD-endopeptidase MepM/ murein hydrolase activator NlpD
MPMLGAPSERGSVGVVPNQSIRAMREKLANWFPDREFFMRSQGQVRFIRVSSRLQKRVAAGVVGVALAWVLSIAGMAFWQWHQAPDNAALLKRQAKVETAENRVAAYRKGVGDVAQDLARRQEFIEKMVQAHLGELPKDQRAGETVTNSQSEAAQTVHKISAAIPEAAGLAQMEARQLAFVESLTRYADRKANEDAGRMRRMGINPDVMLAAVGRSEIRGEAMGGPLLPLFTGRDGGLDPRFARLGASLARMSALQLGLSRLPQVLPANLSFLSSGFGYRLDPFTRSGSFHPGLDFRGPIGAPIFAAAPGRITFAARKAGYGNCIEITHADGIITRYAHMSAFRARLGQSVGAGQMIGAIGSTGRSTGPHLHFEVRVHDRAINPRPFLEAIAHVSEENRANPTAND